MNLEAIKEIIAAYKKRDVSATVAHHMLTNKEGPAVGDDEAWEMLKEVLNADG